MNIKSLLRVCIIFSCCFLSSSIYGNMLFGSTLPPIVGADSVCVNSNIQLTNAQSGGVWTSKDKTKATVDLNSGIVTGVSAGTDTIFYTVIISKKLTLTVAKTITVVALPSISPIAGNSLLCFNAVDSLTCFPNGGVWSSNDSTIVQINSITGVIKAVNGGIAIINYTVTSLGCTNSVFTFIQVNPKLITTPIQSSSDSACLGTSITLSNSTGGGYWFHNQPSKATLVSNGNTATLSANAPTWDTIYYAYTDAATGCADTVYKVIVINSAGCNCCPQNLGFEYNSFANWTAVNGSVGLTNTQFTLNAVGPTINLHEVTPSPRVLSIDKYGNFPTVCGAGGGNHSVRLNNESSGGKAVQITYLINIPPNQQQYVLKYYYAVVLENPSHLSNQEPGFVRTIFDNTSNSTIPCISANYEASSVSVLPGWKTSTVKSLGGNQVYYCSWTPVSVYLKNKGGHQIKLQFTAFDCTLGGHFGYAYVDIDTSCSADINAQTGNAIVTGTEYCKNVSTVSLKAPSGYKTYTWADTSFTKQIVFNANNIYTILKPTVDTTYGKLIVTPYPGFGCSDTISYKVIGHEVPKVSAIKGYSSVCVSNKITLRDTTIATAASGTTGVWTSSNPAILQVINSGNILSFNNLRMDLAVVKGVSSGTTAISYLAKNNFGCSDSTNFSITVNPLPQLSAISGPSSACAGTKLVFGNSNKTGIWTSKDTSIVSVNSSGIGTAKNAGSTTIKYTVFNAQGCQDSALFPVSVFSTPIVPPIIGSNFTCNLLPISLTDSLSGGLWISSDTSVATINSVGLVNAKKSGKTTVGYVVSNSICADTAKLVVNIQASPTTQSIQLNGCNSIIYKGKNYSSSTSFVDTTKSKFGCDSIYTNTVLRISKQTPTTQNISLNGCDSVLYNSVYYKKTSNISDTLKNNFGCDSIYKNVSIVVTPSKKTSLTISATQTNIIYGSPVTFNVAVFNQGTNIQYQWVKNRNNILNATAASYTANDLNNGDTIYCIIKTKTTCSIDSLFVSNSIGMNVSYNALVSGNIIHPTGTGIPNVSVSIKSNTANTNDFSYAYSINAVAGNSYTIRASKNNDIKKSNGVSAIDIALLQSHLLQKSILNSPYKIIAADVDNSKSLSSIDIVFMKRLILGLDTTFKGNRLWAFVDSAYVFPNPTNPFPYKDSFVYAGINENKTNQTFIGMKLGDINYDWNPNILRMSRTQKPLGLYNNSITPTENNTIHVPVLIRNFEKLLAIQFTLKYNQNVMEFKGLASNPIQFDFATNHTKEGYITFVWNEKNGTAKTLSDGSVLFELVFDKIAPFTTEDIQINSHLTPIESVDEDFQIHDIIKSTNSIVTNQSKPTNDLMEHDIKVEKWDFLPNPTNGLVTVNMSLLSKKSIQLELTNEAGQIVFNQMVSMPMGNSSVSIQLNKENKLSSGVYFLKAKGIKGDTVKRIIIE